jgi:hypothetical protein
LTVGVPFLVAPSSWGIAAFQLWNSAATSDLKADTITCLMIFDLRLPHFSISFLFFCEKNDRLLYFLILVLTGVMCLNTMLISCCLLCISPLRLGKLHNIPRIDELPLLTVKWLPVVLLRLN